MQNSSSVLLQDGLVYCGDDWTEAIASIERQVGFSAKELQELDDFLRDFQKADELHSA
jgi:hypothetical protein